MTVIDDLDRKILAELQQDGRMTNAALAERVHLSQSACLRRVRRLEESGVIDRYVMLVDPTAAGISSHTFVEITLSSQSDDCLNTFEAAVKSCAEVMECYLMAGDADYLLRVVAADTAAYEQVHRTLSRLPGVARTRTSFVLRHVSKKTAYPL